MLHAEHVAAVADVGNRHAEQTTQFEDLRGRVVFEPRTDDGLRELAVAAPPAHRVQALVAREIRAPDHVGEVVPLLGREDAQTDPSVLAAHDLRPVTAARHHRHGTGEASVQRRVVHEAHAHHFECRDVHGRPSTEPGAVLARGQGGEGSHGARRPLPVPDPHLQRRGLARTAPRHEPAPGLQRELVARHAGEGSNGSERADGDDARVGGVPGSHEVEAFPGDDDVRLAYEVRDASAVPGRDRGLALVEEREQGPGLDQPFVGRRGRPPSQRLSAGTFHLRHVGAEIGEELRGVAARDALGRVDDAQTGKCREGHLAS